MTMFFSRKKERTDLNELNAMYESLSKQLTPARGVATRNSALEQISLLKNGDKQCAKFFGDLKEARTTRLIPIALNDSKTGKTVSKIKPLALNTSNAAPLDNPLLAEDIRATILTGTISQLSSEQFDEARNHYSMLVDAQISKINQDPIIDLLIKSPAIMRNPALFDKTNELRNTIMRWNTIEEIRSIISGQQNMGYTEILHHTNKLRDDVNAFIRPALNGIASRLSDTSYTTHELVLENAESLAGPYKEALRSDGLITFEDLLQESYNCALPNDEVSAASAAALEHLTDKLFEQMYANALSHNPTVLARQAPSQEIKSIFDFLNQSVDWSSALPTSQMEQAMEDALVGLIASNKESQESLARSPRTLQTVTQQTVTQQTLYTEDFAVCDLKTAMDALNQKLNKIFGIQYLPTGAKIGESIVFGCYRTQDAASSQLNTPIATVLLSASSDRQHFAGSHRTISPAVVLEDGRTSGAVGHIKLGKQCASSLEAMPLEQGQSHQANSSTMLKVDDLVSLFHEFGHATANALTADTFNAEWMGNDLCADLTEMPSQLFELLMLDDDVLEQFIPEKDRYSDVGNNLKESIRKVALRGMGGIDYTGTSNNAVERMIQNGALHLALLKCLRKEKAPTVQDIQNAYGKVMEKHGAKTDGNAKGDANFIRQILGEMTSLYRPTYQYYWGELLAAHLKANLFDTANDPREAGKLLVSHIFANGGQTHWQGLQEIAPIELSTLSSPKNKAIQSVTKCLRADVELPDSSSTAEASDNSTTSSESQDSKPATTPLTLRHRKHWWQRFSVFRWLSAKMEQRRYRRIISDAPGLDEIARSSMIHSFHPPKFDLGHIKHTINTNPIPPKSTYVSPFQQRAEAKRIVQAIRQNKEENEPSLDPLYSYFLTKLIKQVA